MTFKVGDQVEVVDDLFEISTGFIGVVDRISEDSEMIFVKFPDSKVFFFIPEELVLIPLKEVTI